MVTIWVLTRVSRSIRNGRRKVRPGWRTLVRSRPYRNTTPRSYCRTVCTEVASASAAAATTARMTTVHKKVISSTPLRFRGSTHDPARHVRGEGIFVGHPSGLTGAPAPASAATLLRAGGGRTVVRIPWPVRVVRPVRPAADEHSAGDRPRVPAAGAGLGLPELAQGGVRGRDRLGLRPPGARLGHPLHRPGRLPGVEPRSASSASIDAPRLAHWRSSQPKVRPPPRCRRPPRRQPERGHGGRLRFPRLVDGAPGGPAGGRPAGGRPALARARDAGEHDPGRRRPLVDRGRRRAGPPPAASAPPRDLRQVIGPATGRLPGGATGRPVLCLLYTSP